MTRPVRSPAGDAYPPEASWAAHIIDRPYSPPNSGVPVIGIAREAETNGTFEVRPGPSRWTDEAAHRLTELKAPDWALEVHHHIEMQLAAWMMRCEVTSVELVINREPCGSLKGRVLQLRREGTLVTKLLDDEHGNYLDLTQVPVNADVSGEMRLLNTRHGAGSARLWQLVVEFDDDDGWGGGPSVWLQAGLAGPRGALIWVEPGRAFVPAAGVRRLADSHDWLSYFDWSGTPCSVRGAASVPIEQVFAAVDEVVATRRTAHRAHQQLGFSPDLGEERDDPFTVTESEIDDLIMRVAGQRRRVPGASGTASADRSRLRRRGRRSRDVPRRGGWDSGGAVGDPMSPGTHGTNNVDYVAGSGVSLRAAGQALREFLATGELPHTIRWVFEADLEAGPVHVFKRGA